MLSAYPWSFRVRDERIDELYRFALVASEQEQMADIGVADPRAAAMGQVARWANLSMHPDFPHVWANLEVEAPYVGNLLWIPNSWFFRPRRYLQYFGLLNEIEQRIGPGALDFGVDPGGPAIAVERLMAWSRLVWVQRNDAEMVGMVDEIATLMRRVYRVLDHPTVAALRGGPAPAVRFQGGPWWSGPDFLTLEQLVDSTRLRREVGTWCDQAWNELGASEPR